MTTLIRFRGVLLLILALGLSGNSPAQQSFPVQVAYAPQTTLSLLLHAVESARRSILVNIYEFTSPEIAAALIAKINEGVRVEVLLEGEPVSGIKPDGRVIQAEIVKAMKRARTGCRFYEMRAAQVPGSPSTGKRRYRFDHAKYMVIDNENVLVGSENYGSSSHPARPDALGSRGWEVFVEHAQLNAFFRQTFINDTQTKFGDIFELVEGAAGSSYPVNAPIPKWVVDGQNSLPALVRYLGGAVANPTLTATGVIPVFSPETSLSGILSLVNSAKRSLDVQQMNFPFEWVGIGANSPFFEAVIAAARRGVRVRVLLNDERAFGPPGAEDVGVSKNDMTVKLLRMVAEKEGLPMEARIANLKQMKVTYIHNKGVLVDGALTLISSINWTENSVKNNREASVLVQSPEVNQFYSKLFTWDWDQSAVAGPQDPAVRPVDPRADVCPLGLRVRGEWGAVNAALQPAIGFYPSLSNQRGEEIFHRISRRSLQGGCLYLREKDLLGIGHSQPDQFLEVRRQIFTGPNPEIKRTVFWNVRLQHGGVAGAISLRAELPGLLPKGNFDGKYPARIVDTIGVEEDLGSALLTLEAWEVRI